MQAPSSRLVQEARLLPVLIVDEAQFLRNDVLDDLRLLTNYTMDSEHRLCLLLVGLTELRRRLSMAVHESLNQRLVLRHHIAGLQRDEPDAYLTHRLRLAGCELPLFEPPSAEALFQTSRGLPRQINRIAHYTPCRPVGRCPRRRSHRQSRPPATCPRRTAPLMQAPGPPS